MTNIDIDRITHDIARIFLVLFLPFLPWAQRNLLPVCISDKTSRCRRQVEADFLVVVTEDEEDLVAEAEEVLREVWWHSEIRSCSTGCKY